MVENLNQIIPGEIVKDMGAKTPQEKKRMLRLVRVSNRMQSVRSKDQSRVSEELRTKNPLLYRIKESERRFFGIAMGHLSKPILERPIKKGEPEGLRLIDKLQESGQDAVMFPQLDKIRIVLVAAGVGVSLVALGGFLAYQHSHPKK